MDAKRLERQIEFILELDRLKTVLRRTRLIDRSRNENSAEHSWHLAMMALVLAEHAEEPGLDLGRVIEMVLVHDVVEIDAGDTFCYDEEANRDKEERERAAAERLFGLLPEDQGARLKAAWQEFEARATPEARFAAALDRLQPLISNFHTEGASWRRHGITRGQVVDRNGTIEEGSQSLWSYAEQLIDEAVRQGFLDPG